MLEMRERCERCETTLGAADDAAICSFECTYCPACAGELQDRCPNCDGELVARPRRGRGRGRGRGPVASASTEASSQSAPPVAMASSRSSERSIAARQTSPSFRSTRAWSGEREQS